MPGVLAQASGPWFPTLLAEVVHVDLNQAGPVSPTDDAGIQHGPEKLGKDGDDVYLHGPFSVRDQPR